MRRRSLLRLLAAAAAWLRVPRLASAQTAAIGSADEARLRALAEVVLPTELGAAGRSEIVDQFLRWIRNYRADAEMDHGYGFTRLRRLPPSPALKYPAQLASLDKAARATGGTFETVAADVRRAVVEDALTAAKVERLPPRPTGEHIASDLMGFYFHGPAANDLAYRAAIGRDECRDLPDSDKRPARSGTR